MKEAVNHPDHYNQGGIEVIDAIEAWQLDFCTGNAVKYIARAGKKDASKTVEDLKKAVWYLNWEIGAIEKQSEEIKRTCFKRDKMEELEGR